MSETYMVSFAGEGSGEEELTWGQRFVWQSMQLSRTSLPMSAISRLPPGTTVEQLADDLRFYMSRYESMRTLLRLRPDGTVRQVVFDRGDIPLSIVDSDDPERTAAEIIDRDQHTLFDYEHEWSMRMTVVRQDGVPTHLAATLCHLAADGVGVRVMMDELAARDPATGTVAGPVKGMTARELARLQRTPQVQRVGEAALRYWEGWLRRIPPSRFPGSAVPREPRYWRVTFRSRALHLAVLRIAAREQVQTAPVLLAVVAVALARVTGVNPVVTQVVASNRFRPGLADVVSPIGQNGLCVIDVGGVSFVEAMSRASSRAMSAYKHAYYDPPRLLEVRARVDQERGYPGGIDIECLLNDRRMSSAPVVTEPPSVEHVQAAKEMTVLEWAEALAHFNLRLMLSFDDVADTAALTVSVDTAYLSQGDLESFLYGMEAVAIEAALDPAAMTGVAPGLLPAG